MSIRFKKGVDVLTSGLVLFAELMDVHQRFFGELEPNG